MNKMFYFAICPGTSLVQSTTRVWNATCKLGLGSWPVGSVSRSFITLDACNSSILPILSLSCTNVGRISEFCSQQSLMIVYMSRGQLWGCSMRWPSLRKSSNCSVGKPGYGAPPRVKISHKQTPNDHLNNWTQRYHTVFQVILRNISPKWDRMLKFLQCSLQAVVRGNRWIVLFACLAAIREFH